MDAKDGSSPVEQKLAAAESKPDQLEEQKGNLPKHVHKTYQSQSGFDSTNYAPEQSVKPLASYVTKRRKVSDLAVKTFQKSDEE